MSEQRLFRGLAVPAQYYKLVRHMLQVDDFRESLRELKATWDNLSLLGQLTGIGADVGETREDFNKLTEKLIASLMEESVHKVVDNLAERAQVSIDIVVRNLFERTADIGFLATDSNIVAFFNPAFDEHARQQAADDLQQRFMAYVQKYSVYSNVILLSPEGEIVAQLDDAHHPRGFVSSDPLVRETLTTNAPYVETFRACELDPCASRSLIYSAPVRASGGQAVGVLCLVFRFQNEMEGIFADLSAKNRDSDEHDWSVMTLLDHTGQVIASNSPWQIPVGQHLEMVAEGEWKCIQCGSGEYLAVTRKTHGYQGYFGLGWLGQVLIPLQYAFPDTEQAGDSEVAALSYLVKSSGLFSERFTQIPVQADQIQRQLNRSVWNGNLQRDLSTRTFNESFSKILLWEISNTGAKTRDVFARSIGKLNETALSRFLQEHSFMAALAIDIMDRNLYERANDCRWWALTKDFQEMLAKPVLEDADRQKAHSILSYINSLYTVYSNLILFDQQGVVLASTSQPELVGTVLGDEWVGRCLSLRDEQQYVVSAFESSRLYGDRPTYIYAAGIRHPSRNQTIGGVAIVFDGAPQFESMICDAIPPQLDMGGQHWRGYFVDQALNVIASNHEQGAVGQRLQFPAVEAMIQKLGKGEVCAKLLELDGVYYAVGMASSKGYREYKSESDVYQSNVYSVIMKRLGQKEAQGPVHKTSGPVLLKTENAYQTQGVEIATFLVGEQWVGVSAADAVEAINKPKMINLPNAPSWIAGLGVYKSGTIMVVDTLALLGLRKIEGEQPPEQVVILKKGVAGEGARIFGLLVHDLGGVLTISEDQFMSASVVFDSSQTFVESLAKTAQGILTVMSAKNIGLTLDGQGVAA